MGYDAMAQLSQSHVRYRTRRQMAEDVALALNSPMSHGGKHSVLAEVMWSWTEIDGKYDGCRYWSSLARLEHADNPSNLGRRLRHDHIVPKRVILGELFALEKPTPSVVHDLLEKVLFGCVITKEEDNVLSVRYRASMPPEFGDPSSPEFRDPWLRYRRCGIDVHDLTGGTIVTRAK